MLYLAYLGEAKKINFKYSDKKLLIVRKPMGTIPHGFIHVPQLSPSLELFNKTQLWKQNQFTEKEKEFLNNRGIDFEGENAWWTIYNDYFLKEIQNRPDMVKEIEKRKQMMDNGNDIYMFCYCKDVDHCHRKLIGEAIEKDGYKVDFGKTPLPIQTEIIQTSFL